MRVLQGGLLIAASTAAFAYATAWLLLTPFIEDGHPLHRLFPPVEALLLPICFAITSVVACICIHVGSLLVRDALGGGRSG